MRDLIAKTLSILFIFVFISCQENELQEVVVSDVDQDMIDALKTADDYLSSANARSTNNSSAEVTVIRYQDGLTYRTDSESDSYETLFEQTITAQTESGNYVFWHAGIGLGELIGIEFDEDSEEFLGEDNLPFEVTSGKTWAVFIPDPNDGDDDEQILKYDILYKTASGQVIRFDPKLKINTPGFH